MTEAPTLIHAGTIIRRNEALLVAPVHDETVMMDITKGHYYGLDSIGGDIWAQLATPRSLEDLIRVLARDYDADEATIAADVRVLLADMAEHGVVTLG